LKSVLASEGKNDVTKMVVILSLSKDSGQRPLRASLRQAQTDRSTRLKIQYVMGRNEGSISRLYRANNRSFTAFQDDKSFLVNMS
jgi:hypothetical protein